MVEIYLCDLTEEAQERVLDFWGLSEEAGNFDINPLFILEPIENPRTEE